MSGGHSGAHGETNRLLLGARNDGAATGTLQWTLERDGAPVAEGNLTVEPGGILERRQALEPRAVHTLVARVAEGEPARFTVDTVACGGTTHLVLAFSGGAAPTEATRECHD